MRYGVVVCTKEHISGAGGKLDFATREVEDEDGVKQALDEVFAIGKENWKFVMVCHVEDMPLMMEGFVPHV